MNPGATDNTLATVRSKLTLYSWLLCRFISSLSPLSDISTRDKKPMGGYHPEQFHGHLMCSSLSDHALTGTRPKIRRPGRAHTSLPRCCFFRRPSKYNCHLLGPLHSTRLTLYTFAQNIRLLGMVLSAAGSPYHWQCLPIAGPRSWLLTALLGIFRARLTHHRRRHPLCHHYSHSAASL